MVIRERSSKKEYIELFMASSSLLSCRIINLFLNSFSSCLSHAFWGITYPIGGPTSDARATSRVARCLDANRHVRGSA